MCVLLFFLFASFFLLLVFADKETKCLRPRDHITSKQKKQKKNYYVDGGFLLFVFALFLFFLSSM